MNLAGLGSQDHGSCRGAASAVMAINANGLRRLVFFYFIFHRLLFLQLAPSLSAWLRPKRVVETEKSHANSKPFHKSHFFASHLSLGSETRLIAIILFPVPPSKG